jgi:type I restriction enzyme S subunit
MFEIADINPRRPREISSLADDYDVTFVPMTAINQYKGIIDGAEIRPIKEVRKGFTYFEEDDVIFAKITPCMQNGKSAIARGLSNSLGFGSTEFHVIRPHTDKVIGEWLWYFVRQLHFRTEGVHHFHGAVGQQRVPPEYLAKAQIPLPVSLTEQRRIVARIQECIGRLDEIENKCTIINDELAAIFPAIVREKFCELAKHTSIEQLENVTEIKGGGSLPVGSTQDTGENAILLLKVGDMNAPGNERLIQVSRAYISLSKAGNRIIDSGAVIFPKRGGAIATNKKRMLGRPAMIDPNLMAVIAKKGRVISEYLYYWIQTIDLTEISNGGVIPQLNRKDLAPLEIPVPEIKTQELIVSELEQAEAFCFEQRTLFDGAVQERRVLRESILRKAFAGEL